jgi:hypothetical protein
MVTVGQMVLWSLAGTLPWLGSGTPEPNEECGPVVIQFQMAPGERNEKIHALAT